MIKKIPQREMSSLRASMRTSPSYHPLGQHGAPSAACAPSCRLGSMVPELSRAQLLLPLSARLAAPAARPLPGAEARATGGLLRPATASGARASRITLESTFTDAPCRLSRQAPAAVRLRHACGGQPTHTAAPLHGGTPAHRARAGQGSEEWGVGSAGSQHA